MFEKCSCNHCSGHIEFDASQAGQVVACPHCGLETKVYVPKAPSGIAPQNVSVEIKRGANPLGIASLVLGIGACVFCWIPFLGLLAIPLAAIGLLLAVIGITSAAVGKKSSPAFPIGGAAVCIVAILVALFVTGWISTLIAKHEVQSNSTNQKSETPSTEESWPKSLVVQQGDIQIKVTGLSELAEFHVKNPIESGEGPGAWDTYDYRSHLLTIGVTVSNLSKTKKIDFTTWRGKNFHVGRDYAALADDNGNEYQRVDFGFKAIKNSGWQDAKNETAIYPQESFEDLLVFQPTVKNLQWLHLELPAKNFGGSGMIRFEIPVSGNADWRHN